MLASTGFIQVVRFPCQDKTPAFRRFYPLDPTSLLSFPCSFATTTVVWICTHCRSEGVASRPRVRFRAVKKQQKRRMVLDTGTGDADGSKMRWLAEGAGPCELGAKGRTIHTPPFLIGLLSH